MTRHILVCLALAGVSSAHASDWPRFQGPNGTGVSTDKDVPVKWSPKDVLWKIELPGQGNGSPIIAGGKIYLQSASNDGDERYLACLDAATGKTQWTSKTTGAKAKINQRNSLASSTPATDGERIYAAFWNGQEVLLHGYDLAGKELWKYSLGSFKSQHGAACSPMVHDGKVFINYDQDGAAEIVAVDAKAGTLAWKKPRPPFRACYSTPFILDNGNGPELIVGSTAGITSYNPKDGASNWSYKWTFDVKPLRTVGAPIFTSGLIVACSGDGDGSRHMIVVKAGGKGDITPNALVWENKKSFPYVPCTLTLGEHLYTVNDKGIAACTETKTGKEMWSDRLTNAVTASPVLIDGKVYAVGEDGKVFVFEATPAGFKLLATNVLGEPVLASPAVADGRLYIRGKTHLFCIAKK